MNNPIFLIGMPGCGKTTLGRALARALSRRFIDLDHYIEGRYQRSIASIFQERGEEGFRLIESRLLREVGEMQDVIIACGGGTPCFHEGIDFMLSHGLTLHLKASRERLHERLCRRRSHRPQVASLSADETFDYIDRTLAERLPIYDRAHLTIESSRLEDAAQINDTLNYVLPLIESYQP